MGDLYVFLCRGEAAKLVHLLESSSLKKSI